MITGMVSREFSQKLYENTYQETLGLLTRAEQFLKLYTSRRDPQNRVQDLRINCEMTRVTSRLTQVMAWLLAQKAALNGELSFEEANGKKFQVKPDPFCMVNNLNGQESEYPLPVRELLVDSLVLFQRILNISKQVSNEKVTSSDQTCRTLN